MTAPPVGTPGAVREALRALGVERLVLAIHDASFPSDEADDTGRGSPYSPAALRLYELVHALGFDGVQLGPQGQTSAGNPSPYDGALFSRSFLSISLARLAEPDEWGGVLAPDELAAAVADRPEGGEERVPYSHVHARHRGALRRAFEAFRSGGGATRAALRRRYETYVDESRGWLERDASAPEISGDGPAAAELHRFLQFAAHEQHAATRSRLGALGLRLYGDLQIGFSPPDARAFAPLFLDGYRLGAPPSRTNPAGQPWGYPVLDPALYGDERRPGPVLAFVAARLDKAFAEYDGLRIDHPHGWVCPWVYRSDDPDPLHAVQHGARLFSSPDLPDHPELARFAIAERAQLALDPALPRHADGWVTALRDDQVDRYAVLFDRIVEHARARGRSPEDLVCEVLSTLPHPLERVMARHGLGRFRVTQKADLADPGDVYRSENAEPADWVMIGNHDTVPLWHLVDRWRDTGQLQARSRYLAQRLSPEGASPAALERWLAADPGRVAQAQLADLFACRARHVMVFFADLFGLTEVYNRPGTVSAENWSLRLPRHFAALYREREAHGRALCLPLALALALRAQGAERTEGGRTLLARLEADARAAGPEPPRAQISP